MSINYWFFTSLLHPFLLLMLSLGVCLFWPRTPPLPKRRWLQALYLLLFLYCTPLVAYTATGWLERRFPKVLERPENLDAIIVLSGGANAESSESRTPLLGDSSWRRCLRAARLYHAGPPCAIILSGGVPYPQDGHPPLSQMMRDALLELGVSPSNLILEEESRNTEENAAFTAIIVEQHHWQRVALVTSATHLWRSEHVFRRHGVQTIPVGCLYREDEFKWNVFAFLPNEGAAERHQESLHEYLGAAYLWVRGKW